MSNSNDPAGWMWLQACDLIDRAERLQRQFFRPGGHGRAQASWEPPVDVYEDDFGFIVVVAMPGVAIERVQVLSEAGTLVIRGVRPLPFMGSQHRVRQLEIPYGTFERRLVLPPGRLEIDLPEMIQGCVVLKLRRRSADE